jgi:hypothetical protein
LDIWTECPPTNGTLPIIKHRKNNTLPKCECTELSSKPDKFSTQQKFTLCRGNNGDDDLGPSVVPDPSSSSSAASAASFPPSNSSASS